MKRALASLIIILASFSKSLAQARLEITIKNIREFKGSIRVGLFNNEKDFLKKAIEGKVIVVSGSSLTITFENLKAGDYAVSAIHDENNNGELDTNIIGIPKEGFVFGNNAMGTFGPPTFIKAMVRLKKDTVQQVLRLKYF